MADSPELVSMAKRFVLGCLYVFIGIALLKLALDLLAQFWFWLALIGFLATTGAIVRYVVRSRRQRW